HPVPVRSYVYTLPLYDALPIFGEQVDDLIRRVGNSCLPHGLRRTSEPIKDRKEPPRKYRSREFLAALHLSGAGDRHEAQPGTLIDRKSTRLNSSHVSISYAVFC